jgi:hypothetical protein
MSTQTITANDLIRIFNLKPLAVEGGLFARTYIADEIVAAESLPKRYDISHPLGTAIVVLFTDEADSFSALHKLPTDEVYHFYLGDPMALTQLFPDGRAETVLLGQDVLRGQRVQHVVPHGVWQGSRRIGGPHGFTLFGTTLAPGYHHNDYIGGERDGLIAQFPQMAESIRALTRVGDPLYIESLQERDDTEGRIQRR